MQPPLHLLGQHYYPHTDCPLAVVLSEAPGKPYHNHDYCELTIVVHGQGHHIVEGEKYHLTAGSCSLVQGKQNHQVFIQENTLAYNVLYHPSILTETLTELPAYRAFFVLEPSLRQHRHFTSYLHLSSTILNMVENIILRIQKELSQTARHNRVMATTLLHELLLFISRAYTENVHRSQTALLKLADVLLQMEAHCEEIWTLDYIQTCSGLEKSQCCKLFKEATGTTPIDHLLHLRIQQAMRLLRDTNNSITEIAFSCGFNDSNYFSRQFRRIAKSSPSAWRQQQ